GAAAGDRRVVEWVTWAFEQKPGRAIQLTPMMPMPVYEAARAEAAPAEAAPAVAPPVKKRQRGVALVMCAAALVLLLLGALAWTIVH
ncbi:MAG TPA: hypothetical protein VGD80_20020, partial [Kofleriaceae bacterium]